MSNPATNMNGLPVVVSTRVTIHGACTAITGTSPSVNETVTFTTTLGDVLTVKAGDLSTVDEQPIAPNYGVGTVQGNDYKASDQATINGLVTTKTDGPWGITGQLTVLTDFSGSSVVVSSGCVDNG